MRWGIWGGLGVSAILLAGTARAQAPRFQVTTVSEGGQCFIVEGSGLDELGRVLGNNRAGCGAPPAGRVWVNGSPNEGTALPLIPGAVPGCDTQTARDNGTMAFDFANGRIAGHSHTADCLDPPASRKPVIWEEGVPRVLPLPAGFAEGEARAINRNGDIIGLLINPARIGFWPFDGPPMVIGPAVGQARDINGLRQIVGCGTNGTGPWTPFLWQNGQLLSLPPSNWSNQVGCANAINEAGVIVGTSDNRPVFWRNGRLERVTPAGLTGEMVDLNDDGKMIGAIHGLFIYADGTSVWPLSGLVDGAEQQPRLERIIKINNLGQIVAHREHPPGSETPFPDLVLLTPKAPPSDPAPTVTITSPWNGQPLSDLITLKATASDNTGVAGVQFFREGLPVGPEDTVAPYAVEIDWLSAGAVFFHARARDLAGNVTVTPLRFATQNTTCTDAFPGQVFHGSIGTQTGTFTVVWTMVPRAAGLEGGLALAKGTPGGFSGTSAAVLMSPGGEILVRNGSAYAGTGTSWTVGTSHHFRMTVDVPASRYSVYLKLANQPEQALFTGAAFRGTAVTQLDHWMIRVDETSPAGAELSACNVRVP